MEQLLQKYDVHIDNIGEKLSAIVDRAKQECSRENLIKCLGYIDLTSLHTTDTPSDIATLTKKVNEFKNHYPDYPLPASICVFPNLARVVKENLTVEGVGITAVAACFPSAQSFLDVKEQETRHAIEDGATEVDIVLSHSAFREGDYKRVAEEIVALRKVSYGKHLKVILESGAMKSPLEIAQASLIALENGADFIKTSTGKIEPAATPEAALVMCICLKAFYNATGNKRGFKPAGGISKAEDAILYTTIVKEILGEEWLTPKLFRIGASSLANNLLGAIEGREVKYF